MEHSRSGHRSRPRPEADTTGRSVDKQPGIRRRARGSGRCRDECSPVHACVKPWGAGTTRAQLGSRPDREGSVVAVVSGATCLKRPGAVERRRPRDPSRQGQLPVRLAEPMAPQAPRAGPFESRPTRLPRRLSRARLRSMLGAMDSRARSFGIQVKRHDDHLHIAAVRDGQMIDIDLSPGKARGLADAINRLADEAELANRQPADHPEHLWSGADPASAA